jgi:transcriptional regulator
MYQPPHFREEDLSVQHALIRAHPLGLLITSGDAGPNANLLPFHLDASLSEKGTLQVHMAKANSQWREIEAGAPVLVVFQGTDAYVTPSWYATKQETGKVVPTWNYAVVQVRGRARVIHDTEWLRKQIGALTGDHEKIRDHAWDVSDAPNAYIASQIKGIVGVEIEIAEIDGKWKVSQNRPVADIAGVAEGLAAAGPHHNEAMSELVERRGRREVP